MWDRTRDRLSPLLDRVGPEGLPGLRFSGDDPAPSQSSLLDALRNLTGWDVETLRRDAARFAEIYTPVGILPPDQYMAQVVQLTHGCSFNTCTFCTFYRDIPFRVKSPSELRQHLVEVDRFLGRGTSLRHSLFLGDANALAVPMDMLEPLFEIVSDHYRDRLWGTDGADTHLNGMHAFLDGFSGTRKSAEDFNRLRRLGLKRVTVGLESGHDPLLEWLRKPGTSYDVMGCVEAMKGAGLQVCLVVLVGAGGEAFNRGHILDTRRFLADMPLDSGDIIYFSEYVQEPGAPYGVIMEEDGILPLDGEGVGRQCDEISSALRPSTEGGPRTAVYDIREFTY
ncbi:MAG: radical SAM protein [Candidatus Latescibacteria bacterium]|nr:radical SAM protein [Candidatus Latescibacterota bacterium]